MNLFSCNLVENSRKHKWFLESIHELGYSIDRPSSESLRRYQTLWLPLVHKFSSQELIPPPDVAWLWHCHRLAPRDYALYTREHFGVLLEANPPFTFQLTECEKGSNAERTIMIWDEMYPKEPFFLPKISTRKEEEVATSSLSGFDLLGSTERQGSFLWQVSGERFEDEDFLREGEINYERFLRLKLIATEAKVILVPTYQIDLMWHTHILSSLKNYNADCKAITGDSLHHDDSLTDRRSGGILEKSYIATKDIWKVQYGTDYAIEGGMYRGEPPGSYFHKEWKASADCRPGSNLHLIGRMGASSTSPPLTWATKGGTVSSGKPAFIDSNTTRRDQLRSFTHNEGYVLGKTTNGTGYWHHETKDFHKILHQRVSRRIQIMESDIACSRACCGSLGAIEEKESKLAEMREVQNVIKKRYSAPHPSGIIADTPTETKRDKEGNTSHYYNDMGVWMYPTYMYDNCGGACGGTVVCNTGVNGGGGCGGSGCGGSGCAGGGCGGGGGGCGGGGCGGGG